MGEDKVAEVALTPVKVPVELKKVLDELKYLELKGDKIRLFTTSDIMREALLKGVRLMLVEREILDKIMEKEAKNGAGRIYTSLSKRVNEAQAKTQNREALEQNEERTMKEENEEEEEEEEEETED